MDWARGRLGEAIDAEVAALEALRPILDHGAIAVTRAGADRRALLDPSPRAFLASRYEAAAERGPYRALRELQTMEPVGAEASDAEATAVAPNFPDGKSAADQSPCLSRSRVDSRKMSCARSNWSSHSASDAASESSEGGTMPVGQDAPSCSMARRR
jgi:hypothetical protein